MTRMQKKVQTLQQPYEFLNGVAHKFNSDRNTFVCVKIQKRYRHFLHINIPSSPNKGNKRYTYLKIQEFKQISASQFLCLSRVSDELHAIVLTERDSKCFDVLRAYYLFFQTLIIFQFFAKAGTQNYADENYQITYYEFAQHT